MGANVEAAETIILQAEKALEDNNLQITKTLLESATQTAKLIKQQYFIQASSILFSSLQRTIMNLEGAGSEVNYIKDLYNKAKEMFDSGQYDEAMDYVRSAEDMAHDLKAELPVGTVLDETSGEVITEADLTAEMDESRAQMERVSKILIRVEKLLEEAINAGYAINEIEKTYSLAEDAFDYQDYKKAEEYALECERSLEATLLPMRQNKLKKQEETEADLEMSTPFKGMREDLPTGGFNTGTSKLSDGLPMGIIGDAPKAIEEVEPAAEEPKEPEEPEEPEASDEEPLNPELEVEKEATNMLIEADEKITAAKNVGLNMPMAERLLTIGESYFDRGDFDKVKEYASKAIKQVDENVSRKGFSEKVKQKIDHEEVEEEVAVEEEYEEPVEVVEEPPSLEEIKEKKAKRTKTAAKLEAALQKIETEIAEAKELGVSIDNTEDLIKTAFEEIEADNLAEAKELGILAKNKIKNIKKNFIKKKALQLIKVAWKEIEVAENKGAVVTQPRKLLQDARNQIKERKFQKAAKLAMKANQIIKKL
jgi:tetratricopeptide (TPR) repeat protein